jgi:hypothetical protein
MFGIWRITQAKLLSAGLGAMCLCVFFSSGCAHRQKTPFDHLYGPEWCKGVYKGYAEQWDGLRMGTEIAVRESYGVLTREGVSALDRLQSRSTPFYVLADPVSDQFVIRREVPERLMFTADMSAQDRERAQVEFDASREHIASDYSDVKRLEWALNGLLNQLARVGSAMQSANREMFNIVQIRQALREGELPFELPYQVTVKQYDDVLLLVLGRLEKDVNDLKNLESGIMAVVLAVRATGDGSGSLTGNIEAAVLAAVLDGDNAAANRYPPVMPEGEEWIALRSKGDQGFARILADPTYGEYVTAKGSIGPDPLGMVLSLVDSVTGTRLGSVARQVRSIMDGEKPDFFELLRSAASFVPKGTMVGQLLDKAVDLTDTFQKTVKKVNEVKVTVGKVRTAGEALKSGNVDPGALFNVDASIQDAGKQLVFMKDKEARMDIQNQLKGLGLF